MKTINHYLNEVKKRHNLKTDYQLAKLLGVSTGRIANYRKGGQMDNDMSTKIGLLLEVHPLYLMCIGGLARAKSDEERAAWHDSARVFAKRAWPPLVVALLAGCMAMAPNAFDISHGLTYSAAQATDFNIHYAQCLVAIKTALCGLFLASFLRWTRTSLARSR